MAPRVKPEDLCPPGEPLEPWQWYRSAATGPTGHIVMEDGDSTLCGRGMYWPHRTWESLRRVKKLWQQKDPGEFWIAFDRRKSSHCGPCKTTMKNLETARQGSGGRPKTSERRPYPKDRKAQAEHLRIEQQVTWVAKMLNAEVL